MISHQNSKKDSTNRIKKLFESKNRFVLNLYFTAGYPTVDETLPLIRSLEKAGADLIEIGIPYSDPVADGPTIQESNQIALKNGISLKKVLDQLESVREETKLPLLLMGYLNVFFQFGIESLCQRCSEIGIDGLIIPDLPLSLYQERYQATFQHYGVEYISLITPQTSEERIRKIDAESDGFLYIVSQSGTTGATNSSKNQEAKTQQEYFQRIQAMSLKNPTLIGFGISDRESFQRACQHANGAIIGSEFIRWLTKKGSSEASIREFVSRIR